MSEYREIMKVVDEYADPEAERKYGTAEDENMEEDAIRVTIIATGLKEGRTAPAAGNTRAARQRVSASTSAAIADDNAPNISSMLVSGRSARGMNLTASDFSNQSVLDDFEIPAVLRRNND